VGGICPRLSVSLAPSMWSLPCAVAAVLSYLLYRNSRNMKNVYWARGCCTRGTPSAASDAIGGRGAGLSAPVFMTVQHASAHYRNMKNDSASPACRHSIEERMPLAATLLIHLATISQVRYRAIRQRHLRPRCLRPQGRPALGQTAQARTRGPHPGRAAWPRGPAPPPRPDPGAAPPRALRTQWR